MRAGDGVRRLRRRHRTHLPRPSDLERSRQGSGTRRRWAHHSSVSAGSPRLFSLLRLLACLLLALLASAGARAEPVTAKRQMVATAHPLARDAALAVLRDGGSAVDAAIAAQAVLAVVEPQSSGFGGGSLLMVWNAAAKELVFYDGLAAAPRSMPKDLRRNDAGKGIARRALDRTGRVLGVPGTPRVLATAPAQHGKLPWAPLLPDAIRISAS